MVLYSNIMVDASIHSDRIQNTGGENENQEVRTWQEGDDGISKRNVAGKRKLGQSGDGCGWNGEDLDLGLECVGM